MALATVEPEVTTGAHGYEPGLDGLRALAVAAVVGYHAGSANGVRWLQQHLAGGYLGVSAFFTLSGFLITTLLLREHESSGRISLKGFYARRARRLLPASMLTILAVVVLTPVLGEDSQLASLPAEAIASLTNVANWRFILAGNDYAATFAAAPSPLGHMWSLSVEEQWYLVMPVLATLALSAGGSRRRLAALMTSLTVLSVGAMWWLGGGAYSNRVYLGTDTRVGELAIGGLVAVGLFGRHRVQSRVARMALSVTAPVALGLGLGVWSTIDIRSDWLYQWGLPAHALGTTLVIWAALQPMSPLRAALSIRPLRWLGRVSYGIYLFHWPIMWWLTPERLRLGPLPTTAVQIAVTIGAASVSYRWLEQPIRAGVRVVGRQRWALPAVMVTLIALIVIGLPEPDRRKISALDEVRDLVVPTAPTAARSPEPVESSDGRALPSTTIPLPVERVMVVGDSFALSVVPGLQNWGEQTGRAAVLNRAVVGCGFGRGGLNRGIGLEVEWPRPCQLRDLAITKALADFDPEVVVVAGGMWDVTDRRLEGSRRWTTIGDPVYDAYLASELLHLVELVSSAGARVVWLNAPHWNPEYFRNMFMGPPPYEEAQPERTDRFNALLGATLAQRPEVTLIDLASWMQALPGGEFGPGVRMDGVHLTAATSDQVADWIAAPILTAAEAARAAEGGST